MRRFERFRSCEGSAQLQAALLIAGALVATGALALLGASARETVLGASSASPKASHNANPNASNVVQLTSRSSAAAGSASRWARFTRAAGEALDTFGNSRVIDDGDSLLIVSGYPGGAVRIAKQWPDLPSTVADDAPEALKAVWRGNPEQGPSSEAKYLERNAHSTRTVEEDNGWFRTDFEFEYDRLRDALGGATNGSALRRLRRDARAYRFDFQDAGDRIIVSARQQLGATDRFMVQARLRQLAQQVSFDADTRTETLTIPTRDVQLRNPIRELAQRAGAEVAFEPWEARITFQTEAPRSIGDRVLSRLLVEYGAKLTINDKNNLVAEIPGTTMTPAQASSLAGAARGRAVRYGLKRPEHTIIIEGRNAALARPGAPHQFEFLGGTGDGLKLEPTR